LQFDERSQHFIGAHDETFSIAMRVNNPDCLPARVHRCEASLMLPLQAGRMN
jgi:hypothetical protein